MLRAPMSSPSAKNRRSGARATIVALAVLAVLVCAGYLAGELYFLDGRLGFPLDDSWIHLAFGRSLAAGDGLAINPGEPVAGSTAPLWTALFAVWTWLPGSALFWAKLAGVALQAATVVLTFGLARDLRLGRGLAALAGALTALTSWLAWSALSGMEVPLFAALSLAGIRRHLAERTRPDLPPLSLAVLGVSALARPEGLLLLALAGFDRLLRFRREEAGGVAWVRPGGTAIRATADGMGLALLAVAPVALYYLAIGGSPLPTTLAVKSGYGGLHLPQLRYLHVVMGIFLRPQPWATFLAPAGAVALVRRMGGADDRGLLPALWLAALPLAYSCQTSATGTPLVGNFGRYLFPLFPLLAVLGALGMEPVAAALAASRSRARRVLAAMAVAALLAPTVVDAVRGAGFYAHNVADVETGDVAMARWLASRLPPEALLGVVDLGATAAILPNPIVDLVGIANPEVYGFIRRAQAAGHPWRQGVLDFISARRPDYLLAFPAWLPPLDAPGSPFRRVHSVEIPDNITLASDELVLYETPWTHYPLRP